MQMSHISYCKEAVYANIIYKIIVIRKPIIGIRVQFIASRVEVKVKFLVSSETLSSISIRVALYKYKQLKLMWNKAYARK